MSGFICRSCRIALRKSNNTLRPLELSRHFNTTQLRLQDSTFNVRRKSNKHYREAPASTSKLPQPQAPWKPCPDNVEDVEKYLADPTWSVSSLLSDKPIEERLIPEEQFDHLLNLSGLPSGRRDEAAQKFRREVSEHLHFVDALKEVNTDGVEPLVVIRDETEQGMKDLTIGLADLQEALSKEEIKGRMKRPRRIRANTARATETLDEPARRKALSSEELALKMTEDIKQLKEEEQWDCLSHASETMEYAGGRYFVVRAGKTGKSAGRDRKATQSVETESESVDKDTT